MKLTLDERITLLVLVDYELSEHAVSRKYVELLKTLRKKLELEAPKEK